MGFYTIRIHQFHWYNENVQAIHGIQILVRFNLVTTSITHSLEVRQVTCFILTIDL